MILRNLKTLAALAAVIALVQPALAATSLCIEEDSTGFSWENDAWVHKKFNMKQYLVRQVHREEEISSICFANMDQRGFSEQIAQGDYGQTSAACYALYEMGTEPQTVDVTLCRQFHTDGKFRTINCTEYGFTEYKFVPSGEIVLTRTYGVPEQGQAGASRDSLVISIGKCSVIAP